MAEFEANFRDAGRDCGTLYVRLKPVFEYVFYFVMIAYQCYDCISDGMNVHDYYLGNSLDVSSRDDRVYHAFLFSLLVSCICALTSIIGYGLLVIGLSKKLLKHQRDRNNTYKLGRLIVFVSLFCQVSFEETIQCFVMYYYIVRCSVIFSFWKLSLFVCTTLSLVVAGITFFKAAYIWFKKQDSLPRKYPSCLASCYNLKVSHIGCVALCIFASLLTLGLFVLNIVTLADIIKYSTVDIPHVFAKNKLESCTPVKITPVKNLVKASDQSVIEKIMCANLDSGASHFLKDPLSINCTTAVFTMHLKTEPPTKKLGYELQYCYKHSGCQVVKESNITVEYSHDLCSPLSPFMEYLGGPRKVVKTTSTTKLTNTTSSPVPSNNSTNS